MKKYLIGFEPISDRLCRVRFKGRLRNITMISAHAPTEDKDVMQKEEFYDLLSKIYDQKPKYDMLTILDNFNAKIGKERHTARIAGTYTIHNETSANGSLLTQFAQMNNLIIMNTCFNHRFIKKGTWKPPGQLNTTQTGQIDHILVSSRHVTSIIDVRTCRGSNCDSDHFLVKAILREIERERDCQTHTNRKEQNESNGT
jgi:hypothetical protein